MVITKIIPQIFTYQSAKILFRIPYYQAHVFFNVYIKRNISPEKEFYEPLFNFIDIAKYDYNIYRNISNYTLYDNYIISSFYNNFKYSFCLNKSINIFQIFGADSKKQFHWWHVPFTMKIVINIKNITNITTGDRLC